MSDVVENKEAKKKKLIKDGDFNIGKKSKKYEVTFRQNRSFELMIGRKIFFFLNGNRKAILTKNQINHPDFKQQARYFSVKEDSDA